MSLSLGIPKAGPLHSAGVDVPIPLALPWAGFGPKSLEYILLLLMLSAERKGFIHQQKRARMG